MLHFARGTLLVSKKRFLIKPGTINNEKRIGKSDQIAFPRSIPFTPSDVAPNQRLIA